jgi:glycosyltransferase involved in cell wall biosynthesis
LPRTTILIPTYNRARWLPGAIESVLAQTERDFVLVISDNASTDDTAEVVARYDDPRITYIRREENCGLNQHYNLWFQRIETEFLFIIPDDDRLLPEALATTEAALDAHPRAALVHAQVDVIDEHDGLISAAHDMTGLQADTVESGAEFIQRSMEQSYRVHASTVNLRTEAVRTTLLDERDYPVTDLGHWMRVALGWDMVFLARPLARYRIHSGAYSAGAATVTDGGYLQGTERIETFLDVKLRFIHEHADQLDDVAGLRRAAHRAFRRELLEHAAHATFPERRFGATVRALRGCARLDRAIAIEPGTWRLLAGSVIGRRGMSALRRARSRPTNAPA